MLLNEESMNQQGLREYYAELFSPDMYIKTEITQSRTIQGVGEKYTVSTPSISLQQQFKSLKLALYCFNRFM